MLKSLHAKFALPLIKELKSQNFTHALKNQYQKFLSQVMRDVRLQFMCPTNSLLGYIVTKIETRSTLPIYSMLIRHMNVHPGKIFLMEWVLLTAYDYILEVGFGRGNGVDLILERIFTGDGQYYGIELSNYMTDITSSEMINDITRYKALFSQIGMFNFMPYNTDFFDALFHVDVFYSWDRKNLKENCDEFFRVLKPGCPVFCALDLQRLNRLAKYRILSKFDYDPMRYIEALEQSGFRCIKLDYERIDKNGNLDSSLSDKLKEILLIRATKPLKLKEEILPEKILNTLEADINKTALDNKIADSLSSQSNKILEQTRNTEIEMPFLPFISISHNGFHITTPIFYVNSDPHIGHLYSALVADAIFRWNLMRNGESIYRPCPSNFYFSTGTDEHGKKIQDSANVQGFSTENYCTVYSNKFMNLFKKFDISFTEYIRTTSPNHIEAVQYFWNVLDKGGYIFKRSYEGWYSIVDECFYNDYEVTDYTSNDGKQTKTKSFVTKISEENYAFDMSNFYEQIRQWAHKPGVLSQSNLISYMDDFMSKESVAQISISRPVSRCSWGIPVPNDNSQTIYVWLDALVNYLTAVGYPKPMVSWPPNIQVLGIDIFRFHAIYWPAFLLAAGLPLPNKLLVHGHWLSRRRKMSKSLGNVFCPLKTSEIISVDGLRYFLLKQIPYENGDFTLEKAATVVNAYLVNDLGNLLQRSINHRLNQLHQYPLITDINEVLDHCVDEMSKATCKQLIEKLETLQEIATEHYNNQNIHSVLEVLVELVQLANLFFHQSETWKIINSQKKIDSILFMTYETVRLTAIHLLPVTPDFANKLLSTLGIPQSERTIESARFMYSFQKDSRAVSPMKKNEVIIPRIALNK